MKSFVRTALLGAAVVALSLSAHTAMAQRSENPGGGMFRNENPGGGMYKKSKKKKAKKS
jgi:Spy/CpxP family protein refolding chaperone